MSRVRCRAWHYVPETDIDAACRVLAALHDTGERTAEFARVEVGGVVFLIAPAVCLAPVEGIWRREPIRPPPRRPMHWAALHRRNQAARRRRAARYHTNH